jgi:hypothetical protein
LTGLIGVSATSAAHTAGWQVWDGAILVAVVWLLIGIGTIAVLRPYRQARRLRQRTSG